MEDGTLPLIQSPNRALLRPSGQDKAPASGSLELPPPEPRNRTRRKKKASAQPPRLTALISMRTSRADLGLFLTMRGIRTRAHKAIIDQAIASYNAQHPSCPYQERSAADNSMGRRGSTRGHAPETSVGGRGVNVDVALDHKKREVSLSPEQRRAAMGLPAAGAPTRKIQEYTDTKLDRRLQQLEADRLRVIEEIDRRTAATEALQRAARVRQARKVLAEKQRQQQERTAARKLQRLFRGHSGRQKALAMAERRQQVEREKQRVREEAARVSSLRAHGFTSNEQDAALRIQAVARGRRGRRDAGKIVRPFEFSLGGQHFKHRGRRTETPTGHMYRNVHIPSNPAAAAPPPKSDVQPSKQQSPEGNRKMAYFSNPDNPELDVFRLMDQDGDGFISVQDLVAYWESLGTGEDPMQAVEMVALADADGDGKLSPEEFMSFMVNSRKEVKAKKEPKKEQASAKVRRAQLISKLQAKRDQDRQKYSAYKQI